MFRLKTTLVTTTPLRPWRTGWSGERGFHFSLAAAAPPAVAPPAPRADAVAGERTCFIDEDWTAAPGATVVRRFASLAAEAGPDAAGDEAGDPPSPAPGLRAWWSMAGKPSRT